MLKFLPRLILLFIFLLVLSSSSLAQTTRYIGNVAIVENGEVSYKVNDRLGTTRLLLDQEGNIKEENKVLPYGQRVENTGYNFDFTGKELDDSGLHYFNARYYDSDAGKFLGVDPVADNHAYAYTSNNPLKFVDPTGMDEEAFVGPPSPEDLGMIPYKGVNYLNQYQLAKKVFPNTPNVAKSWGQSICFPTSLYYTLGILHHPEISSEMVLENPSWQHEKAIQITSDLINSGAITKDAGLLYESVESYVNKNDGVFKGVTLKRFKPPAKTIFNYFDPVKRESNIRSAMAQGKGVILSVGKLNKKSYKGGHYISILRIIDETGEVEIINSAGDESGKNENNPAPGIQKMNFKDLIKWSKGRNMFTVEFDGQEYFKGTVQSILLPNGDEIPVN